MARRRVDHRPNVGQRRPQRHPGDRHPDRVTALRLASCAMRLRPALWQLSGIGDRASASRHPDERPVTVGRFLSLPPKGGVPRRGEGARSDSVLTRRWRRRLVPPPSPAPVTTAGG